MVIPKNIALAVVISAFSFMFFVYLSTMLSGQGFHDVGELQTVIPTLSIAHPTGFPTYILLGKMLTTFMPFEMAFSVNLLSVVYSLLTLVLLFILLRNITGAIAAPILGVATLGFVFPFWNYAGMADTHGLSRLFLALLIYIFYRFSKSGKSSTFILFCFILGLSLGNHLLVIFALPGFGLWMVLLLLKRRIRISVVTLLAGIVAFALSLAPYLLLPLRAEQTFVVDYDISTTEGFLRHVLGRDFQGMMLSGGVDQIIANLGRAVYTMAVDFGVIAFTLGVAGVIIALWKYPIPASAFVVIFFGFIFFSANYPTSDQSRYYLSFYLIFSIFITLYIEQIFSIARAVKKPIYFVFLAAAFLVPYSLYLQNYQKADKSADDYAAEYSGNIMDNLPSDAVVLSWWHYSTPLWYRQKVLGERPDILIINTNPWAWHEHAEKYLPDRPVYAIEDRDGISEHFTLEREHGIFRIIENDQADELL